MRYDALAAALPHPVYPASPCRLGLTDDDLLAYAPEFSPGFELRWAAVPRRLVTRPAGGTLPSWWPSPERVGLPPDVAGTHELFPVHPVAISVASASANVGTVAGGVGDALAATGAVLAPGRYLEVRPTLSVRTVAVVRQPGQHLKLPLPASTLGLRNRRAIVPGTLSDGALMCRTLAAVKAADAAVSTDSPLQGLLIADDTRYAHAGHPYLGYLLRGLPPCIDGCHVVPVAALTARAPGGRLVFAELAGSGDPRSAERDVLAFASEYFRLVFGVAVRLLVGYGIALESHQQNAALVFRPGQPPKLLVKDFDGALVNLSRLRAALGTVPLNTVPLNAVSFNTAPRNAVPLNPVPPNTGPPSTVAPDVGDFADARLITDSDAALADVFVTITGHLCVGAVAFGLAEAGAAPLGDLLASARRALVRALDAEEGAPAAELLRYTVLGSDRLTGKSMLTAGTLTAKEHTGAADVNKYYATTGPNYLKENR